MLIFCTEIATLYTKLSTYIDKICPYDYYKSSVFSQKYHKMDKKGGWVMTRSSDKASGHPLLTDTLKLCHVPKLNFYKIFSFTKSTTSKFF